MSTRSALLPERAGDGDDRAKPEQLRRYLEIGVIVAALATVPLLIAEDIGLDSATVHTADWVIWAVFAVEYAALGVLADRKLSYVRQSWLMAAILVLSFPLLPNAFGLVRLARLARVLRVALAAWMALRVLRAFGRREMVEIAVLTVGVVLAGGALLTLVEPEAVDGDVWSGIWWAAVTATTVGYGDISPTSPAGRVVAVVMMVVGIGAMSAFIASVSGHFVRQEQDAEIRELRAQLDRIEAMLKDRQA